MDPENRIERLYIHVPFCRGKCGYCAFYSIAIDASLEKAFLDKISSDIEIKYGSCNALKSIYIGGGTPTALSDNSMRKLFATIRQYFKVTDDCEISVECNPESLTDSKAEIIANFANRVSVGVQSFNKDLRRILGRRAGDEDISRCFAILKKHGIANVSCDLINSIPGQRLEDYESDLKQAVNLGVCHLSSYSLTIEEGTRLAAKKICIDEDEELKMWEIADEVLSAYDFKRYEISNFSRYGFECKHNLEIWFGDRYLGLGPSASSFDGTKRWTESANFTDWINGSNPDYDIISNRKRASEILAFGFRTLRKWTSESFMRRTGFKLSLWDGLLSDLEREGLICYNGKSAVSTMKGLLLWNSLAEKIIEEV
ncbi:MAG TPA: radical SAM family heme chaperone HemW [Victivallales bacterium]|nr:radical SAM family heme chaperone HemW [Victivallales bacterium]